MVRKFDQKLHCVRRKASKRIVVTLSNYCHLFASGLKLLNKTGHVAHRPVLGYRSEEHTSELQSLMRISYAVFCSNKHSSYPRPQSTHAPFCYLNRTDLT